MRADQRTAIFELEFLAVLAGLVIFADHLVDRKVVIFTDNSGVLVSLQKCRSNNTFADRVIRNICTQEESLGAVAWLERVPSQSNPADGLSRMCISEFSGLRKTCLDVSDLVQRCLDAPLIPSLIPGEMRD